MPVQRVGGACAVQGGVGNALRGRIARRDCSRVFQAAGAVHRPSGGELEQRDQRLGPSAAVPDSSTPGFWGPLDSCF